MSEEESFIYAMLAAPTDDAPRLMYADWLMERDDPRGDFLRAETAWAKLWRRGKRPKDSPRLRKQARGLDPAWVARVSRPPIGGFCDFLSHLSVLEHATFRTFRKRGEEAARELVSFFVKADDAVRRTIIRRANHQGVLDALMGYRHSMARKSVRERNVSLVVEGLVALVIDNHRSDYRELLMDLACLADAATKLGQDVATVFERALVFARPRCARFIRSFLKYRSDQLM